MVCVILAFRSSLLVLTTAMDKSKQESHRGAGAKRSDFAISITCCP
jgi:hypothetical protein